MPEQATEPRYRWVIVTAAAVMLAVTMGQLVSGLSVFFLPLEREFGWARGDIALINTAGLVGLAIGGILLGRAADRWGVRWICLAGGAVLGLCILAAAQAEALWQLYLLFLVGGAFGGAAFFAPLLALVGNWFATGAGMALGIASAGQALGQGTIPVIAAVAIEAFGWRSALALLGAGTLALLLPLSLLARDPPPRTGGAGGGATGLHSILPHRTVVIVLSAAVLCCCTLMAVPLMHLVPLMQDRALSASESAGVMFAVLAAGILGRLVFGKLADMVGAIPAYMTASLWQTAMVFGFTQLDGLGSFYLYGLAYGFGYSGVMTGVLTTTTALTAPARRAGAMGIVTAFAFLAHGFGGFLGGRLYDITGGYTLAFAAAAAFGIANLVIVGGLYLRIRGGGRAVPA